MQNNSNHIPKNPSIFRGVFCLVLFFILQSTFAQPQLKFEDQKKNFGFVKKGEIVKINFYFTNKGNQPVLITDVKAECSCTTVEFPKQPIAPGQSGKITVQFNTKTVYDRQDRIVEIISNDRNSPQKLRFKGVVLK
ncbi:MAG: DUF1573 domain-containing protein [Bacteroidota bacterium]